MGRWWSLSCGRSRGGYSVLFRKLGFSTSPFTYYEVYIATSGMLKYVRVRSTVVKYPEVA